MRDGASLAAACLGSDGKVYEGAEPRGILLLLSDVYGRIGGIQTYNQELLRALSEDPEVSELIVISRTTSRTDAQPPAKVMLDERGAGSSLKFLIACGRYMSARGRFQQLHCGHINLAPIAAAVASALRIPWSLTIHGIEAWERTRRFGVLGAVKRASAVFAVSRYSAKRFQSWTGLPDCRVRTIANTIHLDRFGPLPRSPVLAERYGVADRTVILTLGRLAGKERAKGFDEVIFCLPRLARHVPNVSYLICGDGPDRKRLEWVAAEHGVSDRVVFAGVVPETEKRDIYNLADVFAMPSRGEGFGIVLLEAMACGLPVVGSKADGTRDALLDGELGSLVDPEDPASLVEALLGALQRKREVPTLLATFDFPRFCVKVRDEFRRVARRAAA